MFVKLLVVLLAVSIGTSLGRVFPLKEKKAKEHLKCSELTGDKIVLTDTEFLTIDGPCTILASEVLLQNNRFWNFGKVITIVAKNVTIINNEFLGSQQDHCIVADYIEVRDNKYEGNHQIHEFTGIDILTIRNVYDGNFQVHRVMGMIITNVKNTIGAELWSHKVIPMNNSTFAEHGFSQPPHYEVNVDPLPSFVKQFGNNYGDINNNTLSSGSAVERLWKLSSGFGIRAPDAPIFKQIKELYDRIFSISICFDDQPDITEFLR
ncbi:EP1-like protein [Cotesia vestalis bracovirus]|nr:EP1-like protein [Cotesia vestalis bracovirus]